jgi:peroxiredoxin
MTANLIPTPRHLRRRLTLRERVALGLLLAFGAFAALGWQPLRYQIATGLALRSDAPSDDILPGLAAQSPNPARFLRRLWNGGKIPHRQFVLGYLNRNATARPDLIRALEPLLTDATLDPDNESRRLAFTTLSRLKHPQLRPLALAQLSDPDPEARMIGLQALRAIATSNDVPTAICLLDDPDPRVVVAASQVLRQATAQDFGMRSSLALPQFTCVDTNPPPPPDLPAIAEGVNRWRAWWTLHRNDFPKPQTLPLAPAQDDSFPSPDFRLQDTTGGQLRLSALRGRKVLIAFWSPGAPASLDDAPALNALQSLSRRHLVVLGICAPAPPSCADEHQHAATANPNEHGHHHHQDASLAPVDAMRLSAMAAITRFKLDFPMLLDPDGEVAPRFKVENFPTYVLIDTNGRVKRRFVGFRNHLALERITGAKTLREENNSDQPGLKVASQLQIEDSGVTLQHRAKPVE